MATGAINSFTSAVNNALGLSIPTLDAPQIAAIENSYAGAAQKAAGAWQSEMQKALGRDYIGELGGAITDAAINRRNERLRAQADEMIADRKGGGSARKKAIDEEARALQRAIEASTRYAEALEQETARIGKTAIEIKKMEVAANAAAAPTEELRQRILAAGQAWETATRAQAQADFESNILQPLRDELALLGKVGPERELAALALEEQAFKAMAARDGIADVNKAWEDYLKLRTEIIKGESALEQEADAARLLNDELARMIGMLESLGSLGSGIGALLGIFTGNTAAVSGPLGELLKTKVGGFYDEIGPDGKKTGKELARTIGSELSDIFKMDGQFGRTMQNLLQGGGTGLLVGQAIFGNQSQTEQLGSVIGGAAGQVIGTTIGGPIGGAIGSALGSVLGGLVGGLFGGNRTARANITGADSYTIAGKDSSGYGAADSLAGSVLAGLSEIADLFGGEIGNFNTTIGVRGGDFRVNTSGTSLKKKKGAIDFNDDAEAAIAYAIADAIADGAIIGIRESTKRLIEFGDDVQAQLQKALKFESVFSELQSLQDPLGYALDMLQKEFAQLEDIFAEAGASAEEYAQLEELLAIKRKEAIESATDDLIADFQERADMEAQIL